MRQGVTMSRSCHIFVIRSIIVFLSSFGLTVSALAADLEQHVHRLVNEHRVSQGLKPLTFNSEISAIARRHSQDMATGRVGYGHEGFETRRQAVATTTPLHSFGENVAWSRASGVDGMLGEGPQHGREGIISRSQGAVANYIVEGWLSSPPHRKNIESPDYELAGVGVAQGPGGEYYFTQLFVRAKSDHLGASGSDTPYTRSVPASRDRKSESRVVETRQPSDYKRPQRKPRREKDPRKRPGRKRTADGWVQTLD